MSSSHKIIRSASVVGGFTLISRALGLVRDVLMAASFGTSVWASAFVLAFTLPNLFRRLFGEGALASSFIPVFTEIRKKEGEPIAWEFAQKVFSLALLTFSGIVILGLAFAHWGSESALLSERWQLICSFSQIMFPYMLFICFAALFMAVLNSFKHFALPAFAPCLLNVCWIATLLATLSESDPALKIRAVCWAVLFAGILQMGIQIPKAMQYGFRFKFDPDLRDARVKRVLLLMGPAALGLAVTQLNVLLDRLFAMWAGDWAPAALFYSERLIYFPLGIFATALSTVLLPTYAQHAAGDQSHRMRETLENSTRALAFIMLPATIGLFMLARPITEALFGWGVFGSSSVELTARALTFYAPGLLVFSAAKLIVPAFYSLQDMRTPVRVAGIALGLNILLNLTFLFTLPTYWKHAGIAFATVFSEAVCAVILIRSLQRKIGRLAWAELRGSLVPHARAAILMGMLLFFLKPYLGSPDKIQQIIRLTGAILLASGSYFIMRLRSAEMAPLLARLKPPESPRS